MSCEVDMKLNCCGMARREYEITNHAGTRECCDNIVTINWCQMCMNVEAGN
jgi:hypothetical protein